MSSSTESRVAAVARGLRFLECGQAGSGLFRAWAGMGLESDGAILEDNPFGTAQIVHSLSPIDSPVARAIVERALPALRSGMEPGGVWRHWRRDHPQFHVVPADLDDTASLSLVLRRHGVAVPDNRPLLLAARDARGLFWSWIIPRWPPPAHAGYWRVALRRARHPRESGLFWTLTSAAPDDVDGIVNVNVLAYLGDGPWAGPVIDHLRDVVRRGQEGACDKWYRGPHIFAYALARTARAGVGGAAELAAVAAERIAAAAADGALGPTALDSALAICALRVGGADVGRAQQRLLDAQDDDGGWPIAPLYYGGPAPGLMCWGSRELTTALCVEALAP